MIRLWKYLRYQLGDVRRYRRPPAHDAVRPELYPPRWIYQRAIKQHRS